LTLAAIVESVSMMMAFHLMRSEIGEANG